MELGAARAGSAIEFGNRIGSDSVIVVAGCGVGPIVLGLGDHGCATSNSKNLESAHWRANNPLATRRWRAECKLRAKSWRNFSNAIRLRRRTVVGNRRVGD